MKRPPTAWSTAPSAACCRRSTRIRASWTPRATRPCASGRKGATTASGISICRRRTATSPSPPSSKGRQRIRRACAAATSSPRSKATTPRAGPANRPCSACAAPKGTPVGISVRRSGYDKLIELQVTRDEIHMPTVPAAFMMDARPDTCKLTDFGENTDQELGRALKDLTGKGMRRLVFDLRGNPGGALDQAIKVSNRFLPQGDMIVYTQGARAELGAGLPRHRAERLPEHADDHAGESQQRQRLGDRLGRAPGSRPLAHRRRDDVRQGARAVGVPRQRRRRCGDHDGAVLHAERPPDSAPVGRHLRRVPDLYAARAGRRTRRTAPKT